MLVVAALTKAAYFVAWAARHPAMIEPGSLQGLIPFTHAAETGSFTRAAERLGITSSAVGKAIALMEARLGTRLMNRTTRSLGLTPEGEAYYRACVEALTVLDVAQAQLAAHLEVPAGRLRIGLPLAFGRRCVAPILFEIAERFPHLTLDVSFNDRRVDLVPEGVDLAIRMGELDDRVGLVARRFYVQRWAVCAAPAYLDRHGRPQTIDDLERHTLVVYGRDGFVSPWFIPDAAGRFDATLAGCGIASLPTWIMANELANSRLERLLSPDLVETGPVHAIWPATRTLAPKIRIVVDEVVRRFSPPSWEMT